MSLKKIVLFSALILFATFAIVRVGLFAIEVQHDSELVVIGGATVEYILDPTELSKGEGALSADFDVTSTSSVVVQKDGALYEIIHNATGGSAFTLMFKEAAPYSFALDAATLSLLLQVDISVCSIFQARRSTPYRYRLTICVWHARLCSMWFTFSAA